MPRILILGANGYIGSALADSLIRSGDYLVYGVVRSPTAARDLAKREILPLVCPDPRGLDSHIWETVVREQHIETIVDAMAYGPDFMNIADIASKLGKQRQELATSEKRGVQKLGLVTVSGMWVHGSNRDHRIDDTLPVMSSISVNEAATLVASRPGDEQKILGMTEILNVAILRPALVYGRGSWVLDSVFDPIVEARTAGKQVLQLPLEPDSAPGVVHVDDVATGLHALVEKLHFISGTSVYPVFDLQTTQESWRDIVNSAGRHIQFQGKVELVGAGENVFMQAMSVSLNCDSSRARTLLGWAPRRIGLVQNMQMYLSAWLAATETRYKALH